MKERPLRLACRCWYILAWWSSLRLSNPATVNARVQFLWEYFLPQHHVKEIILLFREFLSSLGLSWLRLEIEHLLWVHRGFHHTIIKIWDVKWRYFFLDDRLKSLRDFPLGRSWARVALMSRCFLYQNIVLLGKLQLIWLSGAIYVWMVERIDIDIQTAIRPCSCGVWVQDSFLLRPKTPEDPSRVRPLVLGFLVTCAKRYLWQHARVNAWPLSNLWMVLRYTADRPVTYLCWLPALRPDLPLLIRLQLLLVVWDILSMLKDRLGSPISHYAEIDLWLKVLKGQLGLFLFVVILRKSCEAIISWYIIQEVYEGRWLDYAWLLDQIQMLH